MTVARCISIAALFALSACASQTTPAADRDELVAIVAEVEIGWEQADGTAFRQRFLDWDGARYVESGGQNVGLDDLIDNHVEPEGDALEYLELDLTDVVVHLEGDLAWAIANVEVRAKVRKDGRVIHKKGYQTFIFRRVQGQWKVLHTHSSTRPLEAHSH